MSTGSKILIIEDELGVASFIEQSLREAGFETLLSTTAREAYKLWKEDEIDVVVLDIMLPDRSGLELLAAKRAKGVSTPVLVVSAKGAISDRVTGLDAGADDYLSKPFGIEELLARIRVLIRRRSKETSVLQCGDLKIDLIARRVTRAGRAIFLSDTEFRMLDLLAHRMGTVVSKRDLLSYVWDDPVRDDNVVEVYISYLRTKVERGGASRLIHTIRGKGYLLAEEEDAS